MITQKKLLAALVLAAAPAFAQEAQTEAPKVENLEAKLEELKLPENTAPALVTNEKLYSVQNRYSNLQYRPEIAVGGAMNFAGSTFIKMKQVDATARFHLTNRWDVSGSYSYAFNDFTDGAKELFRTRNILADAAFVKNRADALVGFHVFYGKFRITMDRVLYFDQYVAVGPGWITTQFGTATATVADVGMVFWTGRNLNFRLGFKNSWFEEKRQLSSSRVYHLLGHLDIGYTFGGGRG